MTTPRRENIWDKLKQRFKNQQGNTKTLPITRSERFDAVALMMGRAGFLFRG